MSVIPIKIGNLEFSQAEGIGAPHCFTTRLGGVSTGIFDSLNLNFSRGDDPDKVVENFRLIGEVLGFTPEDAVNARQIHSDIVVRIDERNRGKLAVTGAVGAAHAGWKGTVLAIGAKTVEAMTREFGTKPENIRAAIGPNIGPCHFETDADVPDALLEAFGDEVKPFIRPQGNKFYVNLKEVNALVLRRAGVTHIEISDECTMCRPDRFWSHRVTLGQRGAQGGIIVCKEVRR